MSRTAIFALLITVACSPASKVPVETPPKDPPVKPGKELRHKGEVHLANIKQLSAGGENAEAYWSFGGKQLIFQTTRPPFGCDQIMTMPADGSAKPKLVSTGKGRTTCAYFLPGDKEIVYSSTHERMGPACPPKPGHAQGYVWPLHAFDIYRANADGSNLRKLTDTPHYDAEATVCPIDGSIIFTSTRDGDLELYRMDSDGKNVKRLTNTPGYDGGAFFSTDCKQIIWRASRPRGRSLADYKRLLGKKLVRPTRLEIFVANADGSNARQITYLKSASFAPYLHPSGKRVLFSTNYPNPRGREFDIWAINTDGTQLERITHAPGFDGFPMFSFDGKKLAFASNRNQGKPGETDVYVADWVESPAKKILRTDADQFMDDVRWLAADERQGRGIGTKGLDQAAAWLAKQFKNIGVAPAVPHKGRKVHGFKAPMMVRTKVTSSFGTQLSVGGKLARDQFEPAAISKSTKAASRIVFANYGIYDKKLGINDYKRLNVKNKIVVVRRFTPKTGPFTKASVRRRLSDLRYKAFLARERGARALLVVDLPKLNRGQKMPSEAAFPKLRPQNFGDVGIPVMYVKRSQAKKLMRRGARATVAVDLKYSYRRVDNIVGVVRAGAANKLPGTVVVGAHYDHLGWGGHGSLSPKSKAVHNGADDNASGTAALLAVARTLVKNRAQLQRDVYLVAFTAEETGLLGSTRFTKHPPHGFDLKSVVAMINMDMVGRMRSNKLSILGGGSATEWPGLVLPACQRAGIACSVGGSGYGPSDQTPFYAAGIPVLHFFTGAHGQYHKPTDDAELVNAAGGAQVSRLVADITQLVANRAGKLTYKKVAAPLPRGDARSFGAALGTIPDYAHGASGKKLPGVMLAGARPGGPADKAGMKRGDRLVQLGKTNIRTIQDMMYVLRAAKPGQKTTAVVVRGGKRIKLNVTFGKSRRRRH